MSDYTSDYISDYAHQTTNQTNYRTDQTSKLTGEGNYLHEIHTKNHKNYPREKSVGSFYRMGSFFNDLCQEFPPPNTERPDTQEKQAETGR